MFALTIDQRGSRQGGDDVPALLEALALVTTVRGFERTVGDEVQGLVGDPAEAVDVVVSVAATQRWWIGLGVGEVDEPVPTSVRAARGPALFAARVAVERAGAETAGVALAAGDGRDPHEVRDAETVLQQLARLVADRSSEGHAAIEAARRHGTQRAAAEELGITPQAMSLRLRAARREDEDRLRDVAVRLLVRADSGLD